jgi:DNA-binding NarL/FixJ family response regulator
MRELRRRAEVAEIVASIWRASAEPKAWEDVVSGLVKMVPGAVGGAVFSPFHAGPGGFHIAPGAIPEFIQEYLEGNWGQHDPVQHALFRQLPTESLVWSFTDLLPREVYLNARIVHELVRKYYPEGYDDGVGAIVHGHGARTVLLTIPGSGWDDDQIATHKALVREVEPHIYGAVAAYWRLVEAEQAAKVSRFALDQLPLGILWLAKDGSVIHANATARAILDQRDGLLIMSGRLRASSAVRELEAALSSIAQGKPEISFPIARKHGHPLFVSVLPGALQESLGSVGETVRALLFVTDPDRMPQNAAVRLRNLYGLSGAESVVAELLASGLGVESIAERRKVSVHTIRTQIKVVMNKLGASRQSDVVRAVMALGLMPQT